MSATTADGIAGSVVVIAGTTGAATDALSAETLVDGSANADGCTRTTVVDAATDAALAPVVTVAAVVATTATAANCAAA
ncbi:MAG: hypothetical protein H7203_09650 [Rhizobacter sp.]|nr:hypothetical protein [Burkholderiales bacterium]